jgi:hypothetical protein
MPSLSPNSELVPLWVYVFPEQKEFLQNKTRGRAYSLSNVVRDLIRDSQVKEEFPSLDLNRDCHANQGSATSTGEEHY